MTVAGRRAFPLPAYRLNPRQCLCANPFARLSLAIRDFPSVEARRRRLYSLASIRPLLRLSYFLVPKLVTQSVSIEIECKLHRLRNQPGCAGLVLAERAAEDCQQ